MYHLRFGALAGDTDCFVVLTAGAGDTFAQATSSVRAESELARTHTPTQLPPCAFDSRRRGHFPSFAVSTAVAASVISTSCNVSSSSRSSSPC